MQCLRFFDCQMYFTPEQLRMLMSALSAVRTCAAASLRSSARGVTRLRVPPWRAAAVGSVSPGAA